MQTNNPVCLFQELVDRLERQRWWSGWRCIVALQQLIENRGQVSHGSRARLKIQSIWTQRLSARLIRVIVVGGLVSHTLLSRLLLCFLVHGLLRFRLNSVAFVTSVRLTKPGLALVCLAYKTSRGFPPYLHTCVPSPVRVIEYIFNASTMFLQLLNNSHTSHRASESQ